MPAQLRIEGLRELQSALTFLERDSTYLTVGFKAAADIVAEEAKLRANAFSFRASDTIRAGSSYKSAFVTGGKAQLPWYGWADFGSRSPVSGNPRSVGPWAHSGKGPAKGRFIYPAIDMKSREVSEAVAKVIATAFKKVGF